MTVMAAIEVANGDQRIRFEGKQLSRASSEFGYRGEHKSRWTEITIYRTNDGKYVVSKIGKSRVVHLSYDCPPARCCWSTTSSRAPSRPWTRPPLRSWWCLSLPRRGSQRRRHVSTLGDRPSVENSPPESGRRSEVGGRIRRGTLPADHRARAGQQLVLIIIAPLALA
jgi:hypothetical protein